MPASGSQRRAVRQWWSCNSCACAGLLSLPRSAVVLPVLCPQVYVAYFKCNKSFIHQHPNLSGYTADLFHTPGVAASVNLSHIKTHYFTSHPALNTYAIIPVGPECWWEDKGRAKARTGQFPDAKQAWDA